MTPISVSSGSDPVSVDSSKAPTVRSSASEAARDSVHTVSSDNNNSVQNVSSTPFDRTIQYISDSESQRLVLVAGVSDEEKDSLINEHESVSQAGASSVATSDCTEARLEIAKKKRLIAEAEVAALRASLVEDEIQLELASSHASRQRSGVQQRAHEATTITAATNNPPVAPLFVVDEPLSTQPLSIPMVQITGKSQSFLPEPSLPVQFPTATTGKPQSFHPEHSLPARLSTTTTDHGERDNHSGVRKLIDYFNPRKKVMNNRWERTLDKRESDGAPSAARSDGSNGGIAARAAGRSVGPAVGAASSSEDGIAARAVRSPTSVRPTDDGVSARAVVGSAGETPGAERQRVPERYDMAASDISSEVFFFSETGSICETAPLDNTPAEQPTSSSSHLDIKIPVGYIVEKYFSTVKHSNKGAYTLHLDNTNGELYVGDMLLVADTVYIAVAFGSVVLNKPLHVSVPTEFPVLRLVVENKNNNNPAARSDGSSGGDAAHAVGRSVGPAAGAASSSKDGEAAPAVRSSASRRPTEGDAAHCRRNST